MEITGDSRLNKLAKNKKRYRPARALPYLGQRETRKSRTKRIAQVVKEARS